MEFTMDYLDRIEEYRTQSTLAIYELTVEFLNAETSV